MRFAILFCMISSRVLSRFCTAFTVGRPSALSLPSVGMSSSTAAAAINGENPSHPTAMTDDERYLFDLNGFLVVRNVLSPKEVAAANAAIDKHSSDIIERSDGELRNAIKGTALYGNGPGRQDLGRVLEWPDGDLGSLSIDTGAPATGSSVSRIVGKRLSHGSLALLYFAKSRRRRLCLARWHGGLQVGRIQPALGLQQSWNHHSDSSIGMQSDHNAGDGGFVVVPGSHKANLRMPPDMVNGDLYQEFIRQPVTKAGDVVLFSEGTVHGAAAWTPVDRPRRCCLFRFAPATCAYGRSYFGHDKGWPSAMYDNLTAAQRAVLEPPYANRLDRPNISEEESEAVTLTTRSERKKQHDRQVFGTQYF